MIRLQLADPALSKRIPDKDIRALQAFYANHLGPPLWQSDQGLTPQARAVIREIQDAENWGLSSRAFELPAAEPGPMSIEAQAADEIKLGAAILKYARFARGGRVSPTRLGKLLDQKPNLPDPATVLTESFAATDPGAYLRSLHPTHQQFARLRQALIEARHSTAQNEDLVRLLIVNMERWRWMPAQLGSYYVWNNIPAFTAEVIKNGKPIYQERIVVGQTRYPTPIFSAKMRSIVFNPKWVVPPTIKAEDLQPRLRRRGFFGLPDLSVLRQYQLSVSYQGQPIDPSAVDWDRVDIHQYTFTQPPGPDNVLGQIKFNFPNRHAIYMHDTIQPQHFGEAVRTYSHGCIRLREPARLASLLLKEDKGWSAEQVNTMLLTASDAVVGLDRPVPVHLSYFTAVVDEHKTLQTFADVYGVDRQMRQALFGEVVAEARAPADPPRPTSWRAVDNTSLSLEALRGIFGP
jgi:murein L,D-transpeptidase YcbB/YkuD